MRTLAAFLAALATALGPATSHADGRVEVRGDALYVDGGAFLVKGVHYGPWRPGTGPGKDYPYPSLDAVESDLRLIRQLHANTILVVEPPGHVLDSAHRHGLRVIYAFTINWRTVGAPEGAAQRRQILERVRAHREKPALLAWILGHEIPTAVLGQRGEATIQGALADLHSAVKAEDPSHPVSHSNWPLTKDLDLRFLDFTSFNVYPLWPPEVAARGFGHYVKETVKPIAGGKPLLLTEFGVNTLEAGEDGQARILRESWEGLRKAGTSGGVVFEFADEWWKNYDNPIRAGNWWERQHDPDDEKRHDLDPEEYYGLVTADRQPKPAFAVVARMFAEPGVRMARTLPGALVASLAVLAVGSWLWVRRRTRTAGSRMSPPPGGPAAAGTRSGARRPG